MLELEEALSRIFAAVPQPIIECIPLSAACGRRIVRAVVARTDLPLFDNSAMDGYAVRAADVARTHVAAPVRLRLAGRIPAGQRFAGELGAGTCIRLFTGSPLPAGADAVVMQEDTRLEPLHPDDVLVLEPVKPWENVRFRGEDVKQGTSLFESGERLTAARIGLLAALGESQIAVARRPTIGLLATGSELKEAGEPVAPGQIYESNRLALAPLIEKAGGIAKVFPIVPDERDTTLEALDRAFAVCDAVVTCGGVSVGEMDFVKGAFEQLGGTLQFWKVAIKPGRPFVFGCLGPKLLFGLPGNPVSAFVTFLLLVRPALARWQGGDDSAALHCGTLIEPLANPGDRRHFVRVIVDSSGHVRCAGIQASHLLQTTAASNGLVDMPPKTTLATGTRVSVFRWD